MKKAAFEFQRLTFKTAAWEAEIKRRVGERWTQEKVSKSVHSMLNLNITRINNNGLNTTSVLDDGAWYELPGCSRSRERRVGRP